jgi:hypothetical protein
MTNEEMKRAMEFIVEMEAKSSAKIDAWVEAQKEAKKDADEKFKQTNDSIRSLLAIAEIHEKEINVLSHQISSVSRDVNALAETTKATDERLNALINVFERHLSEGRNGKQ